MNSPRRAQCRGSFCLLPAGCGDLDDLAGLAMLAVSCFPASRRATRREPRVRPAFHRRPQPTREPTVSPVASRAANTANGKLLRLDARRRP